MIHSATSRPWMQTRHGHRYYFDDPREGFLTIRDIAYALAGNYRFGGHGKPRITVAEHSVAVCVTVSLRHPGDRKLALAALLHDASEAYLGDIATPHKSMPDMDGYKTREAATQKCVAAKFKLPVELFSDPRIKAADIDCLAAEAQETMQPLDPGWAAWLAGAVTHDVPPPVGWTPEVAEAQFLDTFYRIRGSS